MFHVGLKKTIYGKDALFGKKLMGYGKSRGRYKAKKWI
jgi:hypothetical protein